MHMHMCMYRICPMYTTPCLLRYTMREPEQLAEQTWKDRFNYGDEDVIADLCNHYDVPLVSMRAALLDAVKADADPTLRLRHFMVDCKHPNGQGHTYLAQLVLSRLLRAAPTAGNNNNQNHDGAGVGASAEASARATCEAASAAAAQRSLPAPFHSDGYARGVSGCLNTKQALLACSPASPAGTLDCLIAATTINLIA